VITNLENIFYSVKMVYFCVHSTKGKGVLPSAHSEETPGAEEKERDLLSTPLLFYSILYYWWHCICPSQSKLLYL